MSRADEQAAAKESFLRAVELFRAENYAGALNAFEESYALKPKTSVLYNIGMCQKALFRYRDSIATFEKYLNEHGAKVKREQRREVETAIKEMQALIGQLRLTDAPDGAEVLLNGKSIGQTPLSKPIRLDPGRHSLEVRKDGFEPMSIEVTSSSGAQLAVRAALAPSPAMLRVDCEPEKARVFVDGVVVGECPFSGEVEPGTRLVRIETDGHEPFEQSVEALAAETAAVTAELKPEAEKSPKTPVAEPSLPPKKKSLRTAWQELNQAVKNSKLPAKERLARIDSFLNNYTVRRKYQRQAEGWKYALSKGLEPESYGDPHFMRTKKESFSLRGYGGSYGGGGRIDFATRRWNWFYLEGCVAGGGGVGDRGDSTRFFLGIGLSVGLPISFGQRKLHELRVGLGLQFGAMFESEFTEQRWLSSKGSTDVVTRAMSAGPLLVPELYYVWHIATRFALQVGMDIYIGPVGPNELFPSTDDSTDDGKIEKFETATPVFNGFIGVRF